MAHNPVAAGHKVQDGCEMVNGKNGLKSGGGQADGRVGRRGSLPVVIDNQFGEGGARRRFKGRNRRK